jgi:hypothetical protein
MAFEVSIDKHRQIICCRGAGTLTGADAEKISAATSAAVRKLDDPARVRVLVDGRQVGKIDADARRIMTADFKRDDLYRMATWGVPGHMRVFLNIWYRAVGIQKGRFFDTEAAALEWLEGQDGS